MIVSVDTNVWIAFFKKRPQAAGLSELLRQNVIEVHAFVLAELVLGNLSSTRPRLLTDLARLAAPPPRMHDDVMEFVAQHQLAQSGLGYADAHLLASAHGGRRLLWSMDGDLRRSAQRLGVAFD